MAFKLHDAGGGTLDFSDQATYRLEENGVLVIEEGDRMDTYSPAGWHRIEEPVPDSVPFAIV